MALPPITDPDAVRAALAEYDALGMDVFLEKYGFGPALSYYVEYQDKFYDSKAIAGAAYAHQFPGERWTNQQFSGGVPVVKLLGRLGFNVTQHNATAGEVSVRFVSLEKNVAREFETTPAAGTEVSQRREAELVDRYVAYLTGLGRELGRHRIRIVDSDNRLATDLFDATANVLYEAKSSVDRSTIRLGLGQILDYRRFLPDVAGFRLLLPSRPIEELIRLLALYRVGVTWLDGEVWRDEVVTVFESPNGPPVEVEPT
jgi:hypothetical protein